MTSPWHHFAGKRVLLLQGPVGPFFRRLARELAAVGADVHKVNFNGGDWAFYPTGATTWRGRMEDWPTALEALLVGRRIDVVLLFGDCRPVHRDVTGIARRLGVRVGVFEEGYIRPNYITFEQQGVNGHSLLARTPEFYRALPARRARPEQPVGNAFWHAALWAALYYLAADTLCRAFPHYEHHRPLSVSEAWPWLRGAWRKLWYRVRERSLLTRLTGPCSRRFFLVPLQISTDSQIVRHSPYRSVVDFIEEVVASFARHAPADTLLAIKHHPLGRGYHDYATLIAALAHRHGLEGRLWYLHDQHLPTLFEHMRGAVVINSTAGFSALCQNGAVKTCGTAVYNLPGMTYQGPLARFWADATHFAPDRDLVERFRAHVIEETQIAGNFYRGGVRPLPGEGGAPHALELATPVPPRPGVLATPPVDTAPGQPVEAGPGWATRSGYAGWLLDATPRRRVADARGGRRPG